MTAHGTTHARRSLAVAFAALAFFLSGCASSAVDQRTGAGKEDSAEQVKAPPKKSAAKVRATVQPKAQGVPVHTKFRLDVTDGSLKKVVLRGSEGRLAGKFADGHTTWRATDRLQPGETYRVRGVAVDDEGLRTVYRSAFSTQDLTLDQQTYPSFFPTDGATVGVGMPVVIRFDVPVTDRAAFERHLHVRSEPAQAGAFHWMSDTEVHWRPKQYWKPGTTVTVDADIDSVPAGNGIWGQLSRTSSFTVGRAQVSKVNLDNHTMQVWRDGKLLRTLPISAGEEPKYTTRSGVKVIVSKHRYYDMNSSTIGIDPESADGYDLHNVEYAMRVTYSGEFIHAAPWSDASHGRANVSHGCTGLGTADAGWLFDNTLVGDVVEYTGTDRGTSIDNGLGDWNVPFGEYKAGSAL